ncbi:hypothetical protein LEA_07664 [human gut metagenome]|uniref:Uncharacterized protein n=1 Tax=human gut metagenome TaxID=408170 RepID=K1UGV7_9ZZZZ
MEEEERRAQSAKDSNILRDRVTDEEIAKIVERWTGIPFPGWCRESGRSC